MAIIMASPELPPADHQVSMLCRIDQHFRRSTDQCPASHADACDLSVFMHLHVYCAFCYLFYVVNFHRSAACDLSYINVVDTTMVLMGSALCETQLNHL